MGGDDHGALAAEVEELRTRLAAAEAALAAGPGSSRRNLLKGAGVVAAGGALLMAAKPAAAIPGDGTQPRAVGVDVPRTGDEVVLRLTSNGEVVEGESTLQGVERWIEVQSVRGQLARAKDRNGLPLGRRVHQPIEIRKRVDRSTPLLLRSLCNNEVIEGVFKFFRPGIEGQVENFFTIEFKNGRICGNEQSSPDGFSLPAVQLDGGRTGMFEDVAFLYQTITWTHVPSGATHTDTVTP